MNGGRCSGQTKQHVSSPHGRRKEEALEELKEGDGDQRESSECEGKVMGVRLEG